ncbi:hypothetical protein B4N89_47280 [Embleya scabrispora]|uniref:HEAT repeat domain-containing protein n=1 Tax=Embleya scabrispora TaxID=159449 RepID=A0A1T3NI80_9ACTN|nr:hypothetical protein [Embleya scabrispora]OPC76415.1 hypothetical protein B4N89_47280 [Embleya scabrispora]
MGEGMDAEALHEAWSAGEASGEEYGSQGWEGTDGDVWMVVAGMSLDVREGFRYERVPFARFADEPDVPGELERMRSADPATAREARQALGYAMYCEGCRFPVGALAVPFLLRIAADPFTHDRSSGLEMCALVARRNFWDDGTRAGLLRVAYADDDVRYGVDGSVQNRVIRAARNAIAADAHIPIALLDDPDLRVREMAAYVLAAASDRAREIATALHTRLDVEQDARVRAGLVLAIAQLAREHPLEARPRSPTPCGRTRPLPRRCGCAPRWGGCAWSRTPSPTPCAR